MYYRAERVPEFNFWEFIRDKDVVLTVDDTYTTLFKNRNGELLAYTTKIDSFRDDYFIIKPVKTTEEVYAPPNGIVKEVSHGTSKVCY